VIEPFAEQSKEYKVTYYIIKIRTTWIKRSILEFSALLTDVWRHLRRAKDVFAFSLINVNNSASKIYYYSQDLFASNL
jgi:hypothetical protein